MSSAGRGHASEGGGRRSIEKARSLPRGAPRASLAPAADSGGQVTGEECNRDSLLCAVVELELRASRDDFLGGRFRPQRNDGVADYRLNVARARVSRVL